LYFRLLPVLSVGEGGLAALSQCYAWQGSQEKQSRM